jgi:uronate dehydrogenase
MTEPVQRIMITGAAGSMGQMLRARLAQPGRILRLVDIRKPEPPAVEELVEVIEADMRNLEEMTSASHGVEAIIHLGGIPTEDTWEHISDVNVNGTRQVLEAARLAGVPRVILASSNHAVGMYARDDAPAGGLPDDLVPRPDTYYGWSKAAIEALGRLYVDRHGLEVIATRIGSCFPEPSNVRMLATWLSPDDAGRLFEACLTADRPGFTLVWGVSANTRRWWSAAVGIELGYHPVDDAEIYAARMLGGADEPDPMTDNDLRLVGGPHTRRPVGAPRG